MMVSLHVHPRVSVQIVLLCMLYSIFIKVNLAIIGLILESAEAIHVNLLSTHYSDIQVLCPQ